MVVVAVFIDISNQLKLFDVGTVVHEIHGNILFLEIFQEALLVVSCSEDYVEDITLEEEIAMNVNENYLIDKK